MALNTNLKDRTPRRDKFARKIKLLSGGYSCPEAFPEGMITVYPWDYQIDTWLQNARRGVGMDNETVLFQLVEKVCNLNGCPAFVLFPGFQSLSRDVFTPGPE